ncbi:sialic acid-binding Ig-like lectin 14 isoform X4 [Saccopteryx bilineata]|uniref:sialic acid-binding Ig-like lectin 14 isoform X4 n=1 Tax=Saccopteryx bilineata TaxID=59482 RepID=UPI00338E5259
MVPLLLLPLLWGGSLQQQRGYELRVQESVTVQEGLFVHVPCSFFHPWGLGSYSDKLYTYWYQRADDRRSYLVATNNPRETVKREAQGRFLLADPSNGDCSLSLRDARTSDRGTYSFRVERGYNEQHHYLKQLTLQVTALKILQTTSSLPILEGEAVRLLCEADSNPPAELSWFRGSPALKSTHISSTATLELPHVGTAEEGEFSCLAQNPLGSQHVSFSLSVQRSPPPRSCVTEEQRGSWPLVLTLIRGALMGTGFLLTYGLTWLYYTRCGGHQRKRTTS